MLLALYEVKVSLCYSKCSLLNKESIHTELLQPFDWSAILSFLSQTRIQVLRYSRTLVMQFLQCQILDFQFTVVLESITLFSTACLYRLHQDFPISVSLPSSLFLCLCSCRSSNMHGSGHSYTMEGLLCAFFFSFLFTSV